MNLYDYIQRPPAYASTASIWTDKHIATQMLLAHLSDENDAASYCSERRARICTFLCERLALKPGMRLLDLGCGPGLYAQWFAQMGLEVAGLDQSENSIAYAQKQASLSGHSIQYSVGDYRNPLPAYDQDAVIMLSEDYGVLKPHDRAKLLRNIHSALKPGGVFAMDVSGPAAIQGIDESGTWSAEPSGFWRPHPCVVLEKTYLYPEVSAWCTVYVVCDNDATVYCVSQTAFSEDRIRRELRDAGFEDVAIYGDLEGAPFRESSIQIGVIARK